MAYTLGELAKRFGGRIAGDPLLSISGIGTISDARSGQITFLSSNNYLKFLHTTAASAVILSEHHLEQCLVDAWVVDNPYLIYARLSALFVPSRPVAGEVSPSAVISRDAKVDPTAHIGANAYIAAGAEVDAGAIIGPNCIVLDGSHVGADSRLVANVTIYHGVTLGKRVLVHAGSVIGSDGFGFANDSGHWVKIHQLGGVRIGDDVEIGANTSIDRGAIDDTVIEDGVILDNQIQVAHNVRIGAHTAIAGCVGIAGSAQIGEHCTIGGGVGILGHLEIADGVTITAMSLVTSSITKPGIYSSGTPLESKAHWQRNFIRFKQLDEMARRIRALERQLQQLSTDG